MFDIIVDGTGWSLDALSPRGGCFQRWRARVPLRGFVSGSRNRTREAESMPDATPTSEYEV